MPNLGNLFNRFNISAAFNTFLGRKVSQYVEAFLDKFNEDQLRQVIKEKKLLSDYIPDQDKERLKMMAMPYLRVVNDLTPELIYNWFPPKYKTLFENTPGGKDWALNQLKVIKDFLLA